MALGWHAAPREWQLVAARSASRTHQSPDKEGPEHSTHHFRQGLPHIARLWDGCSRPHLTACHILQEAAQLLQLCGRHKGDGGAVRAKAAGAPHSMHVGGRVIWQIQIGHLVTANLQVVQQSTMRLPLA
jgi:hypothetical protein